ncbi:hypothetical protein V5R04_14710 [Jonesiaceae bacterium BS-20]|uniref:Uncharacterized protein n=1 Tax=Jonesiaceae bacterium BS-20 TaxID=3120821 RepID=A0AAU7DUG3_9MICO
MVSVGEIKKGAAALAKALSESAAKLTDASAVFDSQKAKAEDILRGSDTSVEQEVAGKIAKASQSATRAQEAVNRTIASLEAYARSR